MDVEVSGSVISYGDKEVVCAIARDITERKRAEEALKESEQRFRALFQNASDVITVLDADGTVRYASPAIERVLGYLPEERVGRNTFEDIHPEDLDRVSRTLAETLRKPGVVTQRVEFRFRHKNGSWRWLEAIGNDLRHDPAVKGIVINSRDVTERKALEEQLAHQAFHDPLTRLLNRALFMDRLRHALERAERRGGEVAVVFMDLDNFKAVNDSLGHEAGDELLVAVGRRVRALLRPEATVARLGGDEFIVLMEDTDAGGASRLAKRLLEQLGTPYALGGREVFVTPSIGVALGSVARKRPANLLRDADLAMYRAKHAGKAHYVVFEEATDVQALRRHRCRQ